MNSLRHACLWALLAVPGSACCSADGERRLGDTLSFALPIVALGGELVRGDTAGAGQFARSFAVTLAATEILKRATAVERPDHSNDESFPSGHAARGFAAATFEHQRHGLASALPFYALATYVGYTRVQAGRHRWFDVIGAAGVSAASSAWLVEARHVSLDVAWVPGGFAVSVWLPLR